jgi:DNA-binding CsgD family transcriptional regulator
MARRRLPGEWFGELQADITWLSPRQQQLVGLLLAGRSLAEAAAELGVGVGTACSMNQQARVRVEAIVARLDRPAPADAYELAIATPPPPIDLMDESPSPAVTKARTHLHVVNGRVRSKTIAARRLSRDERVQAEAMSYPDDIDRPRTREACESMPRPCPFVSCSHHLYLDVNREGAIKLNFPHLEVWEMPETCSLDVADRGGITLEEVGAILNLTRERVRQIETRGLYKIKDHDGAELGIHVPEPVVGHQYPPRGAS